MESRARQVLISAAANGNVEMVRVLVSHKFDINETSKKDPTHPQAAAANGHIDIARLLLEMPMRTPGQLCGG